MNDYESDGSRALVATSTVALPVSVEQALDDWNAYQELTRRLLNETDFQKIGQRSFKKKSAWRKYARAFNITDRVTFEHIERADDGFPLWARIRVEASHPNGRTSEADHECHLSERCCSASQGTACEKSTWKGHYCCRLGCTGRAHWSHPGDLPATALTRAKNRAIADLIGAGEISAEEMAGKAAEDYDAAPSRGASRAATAPRQDARPQPPQPIEGTVVNRQGMTPEQELLKATIKERFGGLSGQIAEFFNAHGVEMGKSMNETVGPLNADRCVQLIAILNYDGDEDEPVNQDLIDERQEALLKA